MIAGRKPTGMRAFARGGLAQRAQQRRRVEHRVGVGHRDHRRRSRRRRRRACRSRGPPCAPARGCAGARAGRRRPAAARAARAPSIISSLVAGLERAGLGELGDRPVAHAHVAARVEPRARVERVHVAQEQVRRLAAAPATSGSAALTRAASLATGVGAAARAARLARRAARWRRRAARTGPPCARPRPPRPVR